MQVTDTNMALLRGADDMNMKDMASTERYTELRRKAGAYQWV